MKQLHGYSDGRTRTDTTSSLLQTTNLAQQEAPRIRDQWPPFRGREVVIEIPPFPPIATQLPSGHGFKARDQKSNLS